MYKLYASKKARKDYEIAKRAGSARTGGEARMSWNLPIFERIVDFINSMVSPERIALFGSYARGSNNENSDIDILIVVKNLDNERKITSRLYKALLNEDISTPIDFIAVDYDKYNALKNKTGLIYKTIEQEGRLLYGS